MWSSSCLAELAVVRVQLSGVDSPVIRVRRAADMQSVKSCQSCFSSSTRGSDSVDVVVAKAADWR